MQNSKQTSTIFTLPFIEIFFVNFALQLGQFMMNTLIPKYAHYLGSGEVVIGFVASVFSLAALAARPVSGPAIVSVRKNTLLRITILVITVSIFIYSRSTTIPMLITGRIIHGIFSGISAPLALSMASEYLPEDKMISGISIFTLGQALATAIGPNLAISLSGAIGYSKAFLIGCAITAASFLLTFFLRFHTALNYNRAPF